MIEITKYKSSIRLWNKRISSGIIVGIYPRGKLDSMDVKNVALAVGSWSQMRLTGMQTNNENPNAPPPPQTTIVEEQAVRGIGTGEVQKFMYAIFLNSPFPDVLLTPDISWTLLTRRLDVLGG